LPASNYSLSGPFNYENLTIFLIHGPDQPNSKLFVPLQEAMERKLVIVHETSDVNELAIENLSKTDEVFVQAGDIVKGGQQDRVLAVDLIVASRSGKTPIDAFCVEHGRWQQRGAEPAQQFGSSDGMVATKELKMAAKESRSQAKVWDEINVAQRSLSRSINAPVAGVASPSSLQLTIENEKVQGFAAAYTKKLSSIVDGKSDLIGYVFAINNKLNSADVYSSGALFKRFWPKLLRTTAIEAVAERHGSEKTDAVSADSINEFLADAERGQESTTDVTERTHMIKRESDKGLFFETRDMAQAGAWVHRSYLAK
jgi:ARG/rhodanese/phosphatase superfamily protein